jgi:hypothetical protein
MSEIVNIIPINPTNFELQEYSVDDTSLITNVEVQTSFNPSTDKIEYFVYDLNQNLLYSNVNGYRGYSLIDNNLVLDPETDLKNSGFTEGQYNTLYNFVSPKLASSPLFPYFISQISTDRTEIRLDTTSIPNELVITSSLELTTNIQNSTGSYYDFYLDFGDNQLVIANNILLDTSSIDNPTVLIKLYEALPIQFDINSQVWVVTQVANPVAYNINITQIFDLVDETIKLKGPNLNISIKDQINNSTDYSNLSQLDSTNQSQGSGSLQYQLNSMLAQTGVEINVDYSDYTNFIHFSSAQTRLENFYYKLALIETYQASSSIAVAAPTNYYVSSSNIIWQAKINEIITGFDDYEYYLYFDSGSTSWPKTNTTPPYINDTTTSVAGLAWFASQSLVAEEYDLENNNALTKAIPGYLLDDPENTQYELFIEMIGQYFDTVFLYTQDVTNKYNADNRVNYGVSKDVVADILRDMGIKIYQNNFSTNDLYSALLGFTPSGSLYNLPYTTGSLPTPTGYEYINTYITSSATGSLVPTEDINAEIYKRIYSNLPYLLKKKGTTAGLKALVTLYGIPDTILQVNEFGGQNKLDENDYDLWFDQFNYAFDTQGTNYVSSSFVSNNSWSPPDGIPASVEFRFKTRGLPTSSLYYSQSLWSTDEGSLLQLRYTGSGLTSGSYSGSIPNPYNQFALLELIPDTTDLTTSASLYLPFFDGEWWSVLINRSASNFTLYAGNKNYLGTDANYTSYLESSSITGYAIPWTQALIAYLGSGSFGQIFSGSFQEYRFYSEPLTTEPFRDYVMYPYSIDSNGVNTSPDTLIFRASLGGELYTSSVSIHPKITGSWVTTQSFTSDSNFSFNSTPIFVNNRELVYPNQFPAGIKNRVSNKIRQQNEVLPYSGSKETNLPQNTALSPFISVQQDVPESGSYTPNIDYVEVAFSPQNEINNDIAGQLGYFNIGEYIGDPRLVSSSAETYPALDALRDYYFEKYTENYNIWDYIRLIKYFDNSLFKMIQDFVPARTNLASGVVIKQTTLERNKYPVPQLDTYTTSSYYSGSGWDTPTATQDILFTGSIEMYTTTGSTGGTTPDLVPDYAFRAVTSSDGQTYLAEYGTPLNPMLNLTQSWLGSTPSISGSVPFTQSTAIEFFNGEFSGSNLVVTDGELNNCNVEIIEVYTTASLFTGVNPNTATNFYFTDYDLNFDKTYYFSFTVTETNGFAPGFLRLLNAGRPTDILYNSPQIAAGGTLIVEYLQLNGIISPLTFFAAGPSAISFDITNFTIYEAYIEPDCLVIENNAVIGRPNAKLFDVDFSSNAITAVNEQNIISASRGTGSATPASVPESNYTMLRSANPRYFGSENTSPAINVGTGSTLPAVEQLGKFALVYKGAERSDNLVPNNTLLFNITVGVDENSNIYQPQTSSVYEWSSKNLFGKDNIIKITVQNSASVSQTTLTALQGEQTVFSLFEFPNSYLTTTSASAYNIFEYPNAITGSIYLAVNTTFGFSAIVNAPYWATSSFSPFVITSSTTGGALGEYLNLAISGADIVQYGASTSPPQRAGLNDPIDGILPRVGDIFYHPNVLTPFTVTSVGVNGGAFEVGFDQAIPVGSDTAAELNKFIFIRNYQNLNRISIYSDITDVTPQVGSGVIFTQKETQTFIDNFSTITSNLISKNLL